MKQGRLLDKIGHRDKVCIGRGLLLKIGEGASPKVSLYRHETFLKSADFSDKVSKRLFVLEAVDLGANKSSLARALNISRQSIHNYKESRKQFGLGGLIHNYSPGKTKSIRKQREINSDKLLGGNKARQLEEMRQQAREEENTKQSELPFLFETKAEEQKVDKGEQVFDEEHDWEASRFAGVFVYLIALIGLCMWLRLVQGCFGNSYKIFMVFLLMVARNIRSIEGLKNIRSREAGVILGIKCLPAKPKLWEWFYSAANKHNSQKIITEYFRYQILVGLVGTWLWFTDGHLLPYTGKDRVRYSYNTQRRMPVPGQTSMVTCDGSGRIVDFEIQEGKGDLRAHIVSLGSKWEKVLPSSPVMVFDREGDGAGFFSELVRKQIPFVTWEKNVDSKKVSELEDALFTEKFEFCGKEYAIFEDEKSFTYDPEEPDEKTHQFSLRRIYIWNKTSKRRTCGLSWSEKKEMSTKECALAILSRWGASENTFKHIKDRHPLHYHPGFSLEESENQKITNPSIKEKTGSINKIKSNLNKLYKKFSKATEHLTKDGKPRENSAKEKLKQAINREEEAVKRLQEEKSKLPDKVDVSQLENYKSFKQIDNEGKYLFDFVTSSVWNVRKQMVDWLRLSYNQENEVVDLFYAITACHGWIKSSKKEVIVRLEPLEQPKRRHAQEQLCRKLTALCAKTPMGKSLVIEVADSSFEKMSKKKA